MSPSCFRDSRYQPDSASPPVGVVCAGVIDRSRTDIARATSERSSVELRPPRRRTAMDE